MEKKSKKSVLSELYTFDEEIKSACEKLGVDILEEKSNHLETLVKILFDKVVQLVASNDLPIKPSDFDFDMTTCGHSDADLDRIIPGLLCAIGDFCDNCKKKKLKQGIKTKALSMEAVTHLQDMELCICCPVKSRGKYKWFFLFYEYLLKKLESEKKKENKNKSKTDDDTLIDFDGSYYILDEANMKRYVIRLYLFDLCFNTCKSGWYVFNK